MYRLPFLLQNLSRSCSIESLTIIKNSQLMLMMQYCIPGNSEAQGYNKLMCHWEFQFKRSFMRKWGRLITPAHFMYSKYYFSLLNTIPFPYSEYTRNMSKKWRESGSYLNYLYFQHSVLCFEMCDKLITGM